MRKTAMQRKPSAGWGVERRATTPASAYCGSTDSSPSKTTKARDRRQSEESGALATAENESDKETSVCCLTWGRPVKKRRRSTFRRRCNQRRRTRWERYFQEARGLFWKRRIPDGWNRCVSIGLTCAPLSEQRERDATYICLLSRGRDCTCGNTSYPSVTTDPLTSCFQEGPSPLSV